MKLLSALLLATLLYADNITNFQTLKATFTQSVTNDQNQSINYSGTLWLKRPDLAVWRYDKPIEKTIYISTNSITIVEPKLFQATIINKENHINIIKLWNESKAVSRNKRTSTIYGNTITIEHNANQITKLSYTDELDNQIVIKLNNQQKDVSIENGFFVPIIPQGFDIIAQ